VNGGNLTTVNNYEQLKKVIQEANPEIMELKFGCEVIYEEKKCKYLHHVEGWFDVLLPPNYDKGILQVTNPKLKILGRPIRLADVLLALDELLVKENSGNRGRTERTMQILDYWNLKDDNLDHQSEETKQFLIDLLTPKQ
jgi:hypothetical protein